VQDIVTPGTEKTLNITNPTCGFQWQLGLRRRSAATGYGNVGSSPARGMDICLLRVLCVVR